MRIHQSSGSFWGAHMGPHGIMLTCTAPVWAGGYVDVRLHPPYALEPEFRYSYNDVKYLGFFTSASCATRPQCVLDPSTQSVVVRLMKVTQLPGTTVTRRCLTLAPPSCPKVNGAPVVCDGSTAVLIDVGWMVVNMAESAGSSFGHYYDTSTATATTILTDINSGEKAFPAGHVGGRRGGLLCDPRWPTGYDRSCRSSVHRLFCRASSSKPALRTFFPALPMETRNSSVRSLSSSRGLRQRLRPNKQWSFASPSLGSRSVWRDARSFSLKWAR